jgi:hypothetical protein
VSLSEIIKFPGSGVTLSGEDEDDVTVDKVFNSVKTESLKEVFIVGIKENGSIVVSGNCTIANAIYLMELAKKMIIEAQVDE